MQAASKCVWQHLFSAGRRLQHLRFLDISFNGHPGIAYATAPNCSCLVSCCPSLQHLDMRTLQCNAELLGPLRGLSGLSSLRLDVKGATEAECLEVVCQLTDLRRLRMIVDNMANELLLQLMRLRQLNELKVQQGQHGDRIVDISKSLHAHKRFADPLPFACLRCLASGTD